MSRVDELYPCVGVCMPDEDESYCLGCGRPWGEPRPEKTPAPDDAKTQESTPEAPPA